MCMSTCVCVCDEGGGVEFVCGCGGCCHRLLLCHCHRHRHLPPSLSSYHISVIVIVPTPFLSPRPSLLSSSSPHSSVIVIIPLRRHRPTRLRPTPLSSSSSPSSVIVIAHSYVIVIVPLLCRPHRPTPMSSSSSTPLS